MQQSIERITTLIGARRYGDTPSQINGLLTDSRSLAFPETTLFFALRTRLGDGHRYIDSLFRQGVRNFVVEEVPENFETRFPSANFLCVTSPLKALQRLSERHREEYNIPVVGITGSNGKTIVKEWLFQLLIPTYYVTRSPKSYNSQIGVPLSVWLIDHRTQVGIFEAGISQPDEMEALRSIIQPSLGIMTNIGEAHQENFETLEQKCAEKMLLFKDCEEIIYCQDDHLVDRTVKRLEPNIRSLAWSRKDPQAWLYLQEEQKKETYTLLVCVWKGDTLQIQLPFTDAASVQNGLHAIAAALRLGVPPQVVVERAAQLETVAMRLEVKPGVRGLTLINDSYNSDVNSLDIALDFMQRRQTQSLKRTLILSDLLQSGANPEELYQQVASMIEGRGVTRFIGIGQDVKQLKGLLKIETHFFEETGVDILHCLNEPCTIEELLDKLCETYDVTPAYIRDDVEEFLAECVVKKVVIVQ